MPSTLNHKLLPLDHDGFKTTDSVKEWVYNRVSNQEHAVCLDSCEVKVALDVTKYEMVAGWGGEMHSYDENAFEHLAQLQQKGLWMLGVLSYDLKNQIEDLSSDLPSTINLPLTAFLIPEFLMVIGRDGSIKANQAVLDVLDEEAVIDIQAQSPKLSFHWDRDKLPYLEAVKRVQKRIFKGDVYEMNLCLKGEFEGELNPLLGYRSLIEQSPTPFAGYLRFKQLSMACVSPERYLMKDGRKLISQPIKGTSKRFEEETDDQASRLALLHSDKERAENVMIVDLVRNDLARCSKAGSIHVDELFGMYSFSNVHQMISTISSQMKPELKWVEALRSSFPMGSMTGAPKISAMKIIEEEEFFKRQWYSGALGYIEPNGDFDFNVVIRSFLYDINTQKGYIGVGGAITYDSIPEKEWEEIQMKASMLLSLLNRGH